MHVYLPKQQKIKPCLSNKNYLLLKFMYFMQNGYLHKKLVNIKVLKIPVYMFTVLDFDLFLNILWVETRYFTSKIF